MSLPSSASDPPTVAIIGAGPAGLMAAEVLSAAGARVTMYERMPSVGRKFLMAGRGGLNLTHSEPFDQFLARYGAAAAPLKSHLEAFPPSALTEWAHGLGQETFVGSSGRVFPKTLKASPLLRAWLKRLDAQGVTIRTRMTWTGWTDAGALRFANGETDQPDFTILALGGASWPKLGADGGWVSFLGERGVPIAALRAANCGFLVSWSEPFRTRFAGAPLKSVALHFAGASVRSEAVITEYGLEGGALYALSAPLRDTIARDGSATIVFDLRPDISTYRLVESLSRTREKDSLTSQLRKGANLSPVAINLLREAHAGVLARTPQDLAEQIKSAPLSLSGVAPLERAISTAGGVEFAALDENLMVTTIPRVFACGEMLDWEAPTGGYLLQACFATGVGAARGVINAIAQNRRHAKH
jgi:uncharacterized flavoprotein (TIGR03862 family)